MKTCSVDGCEKPYLARGMCNMHYSRLRRHGGLDKPPQKSRARGGCLNSQGYRMVYGAGMKRQRREHILVAEKALGKPLPPGAVVHHIDGDRLNNAPDNLLICPDRAYHSLIHRRERALDAGHPADWRKCHFCKQYDAPENLVPDRTAMLHRECRKAYRAKQKESAHVSP